MTRKNGQNIGYVRVSALDQSTERQLQGVELDKLYEEKASAKDAQRPVLQECLSYVREGDCLHVHSIDRLARNLQDLLTVIQALKDRGVAVCFHKEGLRFTGEANPMQEMQLQIIGAVAQFERALIKERQREGIATAKAKGKHMGRPKAMSDEQIAEAIDLLSAGKTNTEVASQFGVGRSTLYRAIKESGEAG